MCRAGRGSVANSRPAGRTSSRSRWSERDDGHDRLRAVRPETFPLGARIRLTAGGGGPGIRPLTRSRVAPLTARTLLTARHIALLHHARRRSAGTVHGDQIGGREDRGQSEHRGNSQSGSACSYVPEPSSERGAMSEGPSARQRGFAGNQGGVRRRLSACGHTPTAMQAPAVTGEPRSGRTSGWNRHGQLPLGDVTTEGWAGPARAAGRGLGERTSRAHLR